MAGIRRSSTRTDHSSDITSPCENGVRVMLRLLTTIVGLGAIVMLVACQDLQDLEQFLTPAANPTVEPTAQPDRSEILTAPSTDVPDPTIGTRAPRGDAARIRLTPTPLKRIGDQPKPQPTADIKPPPPTLTTSTEREVRPVLATVVPRPETETAIATTTRDRKAAPTIATSTPPIGSKRSPVSNPTPTHSAPTPDAPGGS